MLKIKNTGTEMKNAHNWFISRWDTAKQRISELEDSTIGTSKAEKKKEKKKP